MKKQLIYVHDPMCSWCWGFEPTRRQLYAAIAGQIPVQRLVGGLAPDSEEPMPESMQNMLRQTWRRIELTIPGTRFNYEFWDKCKPRRSTYPANRAVLAARAQGEEFDPLMTARIQQAYYLEARNPSDNSTLIELAAEIGLDAERFAERLVSESLQQSLLAEIGQGRAMGMNSFPSLAVATEGAIRPVELNYNDARAMLRQIEAA
jgi:putative protein-disulfide isomerase